jgi:hypothetical protein
VVEQRVVIKKGNGNVFLTPMIVGLANQIQVRAVDSHRPVVRLRLMHPAMTATGSHVATVRVIRAVTVPKTRAIVPTRTDLHKVRDRALVTMPIRTALLRVLRLVTTTRTAPPQEQDKDRVVVTTRDRDVIAMVHVREVAMIRSAQVIAATYPASRRYRLTFALQTPG